MKERVMSRASSAARILVVDDDAASLRLMGQVLRSGGFDHVVPLDDARRLPELCARESFDLVILDLGMPHVDGIEAMVLIQESLGERSPPVMVVSGDARRSIQVVALHAGACDYLTKPIDAPDLVARVHRHAAVHRSRTALHDQKCMLESLVQDRTAELRSSRLQIAQLLGRAAEYRDNETGGHILRMSHASALLAKHLGWSSGDCELMLNASPLHDIGKIAIPDSILLKQGPLDAAQWEVMKMHTVKGAQILASTDNETLQLAARIAQWHHEKWDGSGYPDGLCAQAIPQAARIVAVADVFDALRSYRPYKEPWPVERAVDFIRTQSGRHFDPEVVAAFEATVDALDVIWCQYADADAVVASS